MNKYQNLIFIVFAFFLLSYPIYSQDIEETNVDTSLVQSFERILLLKSKVHKE